MNDWTYVTIGWVSVIGGVGAYALSIVLRARRLAARVAPERQRWMDAPQ
jgi:hypothetical protein